jgi:ketosteroid isomerase-like protein
MTASDDDIRAKTLQVATAYLTTMGDWDAWTALWAEDGELEFPYAPVGRQSIYRGQAEIRDYMMAASGKMAMVGPPRMRIHPALDPTILSVELTIDGKATATGALFTQRYVMVFETRDAKLWRLREYWNPLVSIAAFAGGDQAAWASKFGKPAPEAAA